MLSRLTRFFAGPLALVCAALLVATVANLGGIAQTIGDVIRNPILIGHVVSVQAQGQIPALTTCGTTPILAVGSTDRAGTVTMGTATPTGCIITFGVAYVTAPTCIVTWIATPLASQSYVTSATAITLTQTATSSNVVKYICEGVAGG